MSFIPTRDQESDRWLTSDEARAILGRTLGREGKPISNDTLMRYRREGYLHTKRRIVGQRILYDREELNALLQVQSNEIPSRLILPLIVDHFETYVRQVLHQEPISENMGDGVTRTVAPEHVAGLFQVEPTAVLTHRGLRQGTKSGEEVTYWRTGEIFYHPALVDQRMTESMNRSAEFDTVAAIRERYGMTVRESVLRIGARMPTHQELELLRMPPGSPVMEVQSVLYSEQREQIVALNHFSLRADICELEVNRPVDLWK